MFAELILSALSSLRCGTMQLPPSLAANTQLVEGFTEHNSLLREVAGEFNASHPNSTVSIFDFGAQVVQVRA